MENHKLVLPEHLNHYGFLFGGYLLKWVDEVAWLAASLDYPGYRLVTIALDRVEFRKRATEGTILRFWAERAREGTTSVSYTIQVFRTQPDSPDGELLFSTNVTLVRIDEEGRKKPLKESEGRRGTT